MYITRHTDHQRGTATTHRLLTSAHQSLWHICVTGVVNKGKSGPITP